MHVIYSKRKLIYFYFYENTWHYYFCYRFAVQSEVSVYTIVAVIHRSKEESTSTYTHKKIDLN